MSRLTPDQYRQEAEGLLQQITGTPDPADSEVLQIYNGLQRRFYAPEAAHPAVYGSPERDKLKILRRGIELLYPWVRQDEEAREIQSMRHMVRRIDVYPDSEGSPDGSVVLQGAKPSGGAEVLRYAGNFPKLGARSNRFVAEIPPLSVLLTHLLHIEKVVSAGTPVVAYGYDMKSRPGQAVAISRGSAIPLSRFIEEL
jgi:hypothetical protein